MNDIDQFFDASGTLRRCGSWPHEDKSNFVSAFPPYPGSGDLPLYTDEQIIKIVTDPNRRKMESICPSEHYITDQHSTSACNGHAAAAAFTRARKLRGIQDDWVGSGSFVYSWINQGRDNGSALEDGMVEIQERGVCSLALNSASQIFTRQITQEAIEDALKHRGLAAYHCPTLQHFKSGLAAGHPGVAAVMCGPNWDVMGADYVPGVQQGPGNHAVCIEDVVLRNGRLLYQMANSWGTKYGKGGRVWLTDNHFRGTFPNHTFYIVTSMEERK